ncbi:hypothetical protein Moror_10166 [Moniliophthora roreri MCA 2997]|uniref:Uncharacterized protein n=2 Tax=Moniliophthora roreri TaxID=221103 RepID=V2WS31_MONRO|nr:hypothetical protein Moror_10166 [Moniliophthora roreri MCA 2997]
MNKSKVLRLHVVEIPGLGMKQLLWIDHYLWEVFWEYLLNNKVVKGLNIMYKDFIHAFLKYGEGSGDAEWDRKVAFLRKNDIRWYMYIFASMEMDYRWDNKDVIEPLSNMVMLEEFDHCLTLEHIKHDFFTSDIRHGMFLIKLESMGTRKWNMVLEVQKHPEAQLKGMLSVLDMFKGLNGL